MGTKFLPLSRCITLKRLVLFCVALLAMAIMAGSAFAQANSCLQDEFLAGGNSQNVNCTANDVSIAAVQNVTVVGRTDNKCLAGQQFSFIADFEILTTSKSSRSNIGLYFGTGQANALSGTCSDAIISPTHFCSGTSGPMCGSAQYAELDSAPDNCGDTSSTDSSPAFGPGTEDVRILVQNVTCPLTGNSLSLPECTSWQVPGKTIQCVSPAPSFPYQTTAIPGSPSKCSCGTLTIPVQPITPSVTVAKSCNTTISTQTTPPLTSCDAGQEGSTVTYHVHITNTTPANEGGVIVDQICDNRYGNIFTASGFTGPACPAGTQCTAPNNTAGTTCASAGSPPCSGLGDITTSGTCDFTAVQGENATVVNQVTVKGHSDIPGASGIGFLPTMSNTVTVTSSDAPSSAKTTKGVEPGPVFACVTVRYDVTATNTSCADESLTLDSAGTVPALNDSAYGNIATTHGSPSVDGSITGTTCGVANNLAGLGTLSGSFGAGAFPQTLAPGTGPLPTCNGGSYTCKFDGVICGKPGPFAGCAFGLTKPDAVTANLTSDETGVTVSQTEQQLTANVCIVPSGQ